MRYMVVMGWVIAFFMVWSSDALAMEAAQCEWLLAPTMHLAVTVIDYGGDGDDIIVIRDGSSQEQAEIAERKDRPEIDDRDRGRELELPLQEIVPTEIEKKKEVPPFVIIPDPRKVPPVVEKKKPEPLKN